MDRHERTVLKVAVLASFVAFLDGSIVNVALPSIAGELGGGITTQQWVVDGYLLTLGSLIMVAGSLADIFGRVRILRSGLVLFGIASLLCAAAPSGAVLIAARLLQGTAAALLVPGSLALITSTFKEGPRARAIGTWTGWTGTAFVAGPLLGGLLVDTVSWRLVFAINVLPIAATLYLLARLHDRARSGARTPVDVLGALLVAFGLAGTVFALIFLHERGWADPLVSLPFGAGMGCLAAFIRREAVAAHPMMPLRLFRVRNFGIGNLSTAAFYAGISLGTFIIPVFLQEVAGYSAFAAGMATLPLTLMSLALSALFGTYAGKYGPRLFMSLGPVLAGTGFLLMLSASEPLDYQWQLLPGVVVFGLGLAVTVAPLTAAVLGAIDPAQSGIGSAINNAVSRIAGLLSIASVSLVTGPTLDYGSFHRAVLVAATLMVLAGTISAFGISNKNRSGTASVPPEATAACHDRIVPDGLGAPKGKLPPG